MMNPDTSTVVAVEEKVLTTTAASEQEIKRKRGRPPKAKTNESQATIQPKTTPGLKRRGRPPKQTTILTTIVVPMSSVGGDSSNNGVHVDSANFVIQEKKIKVDKCIQTDKTFLQQLSSTAITTTTPSSASITPNSIPLPPIVIPELK